MAERRGARASGAARARLVALGAALVLPLALTPLAGRAVADHLAAEGAGQLVSLGARLDALRPPPAPDLPPLEASPVQPESTDPAVEEPAGRRRPATRDAGPKGAKEPRGLRIREAAVLRAARSGARPSGAPVPASGERPAGLRLLGVGHFGVGLRDGDVLTHVGGAPARSVDTVVAAVAGALRARAPMLSAVVWRGEQPIQIAVELPRPRG